MTCWIIRKYDLKKYRLTYIGSIIPSLQTERIYQYKEDKEIDLFNLAASNFNNLVVQTISLFLLDKYDRTGGIG